MLHLLQLVIQDLNIFQLIHQSQTSILHFIILDFQYAMFTFQLSFLNLLATLFLMLIIHIIFLKLQHFCHYFCLYH